MKLADWRRNGRLGTYSCLSDPAFAQLVEVNEEFLDSNPVLGDLGLESPLHVQLHVHEAGLPLLGRRVEAIDN